VRSEREFPDARRTPKCIRILVVDDYESWRHFVSKTLQTQPELQVISEAVDGLEAIQKAQQLQPDLILLDIGLPKLNGFEAARQIRKVGSTQKILFLSQEFSVEVVQESLKLGDGYVVKTHAANELLPAVEAVLYGMQYVSSGVTGRYSTSNERQENFQKEPEADYSFFPKIHEGVFRVDMDMPMPVNFPEEEQIRCILYDSYVARCNDAQARMYGLNSATDLIGRRMADMVVPDDPKNIELTRHFIRSGYRVLRRKSYEVDVRGNQKVFLNNMNGVIIGGKLTFTWGRQSDVTELGP
jgi:DNA-binding NarL/FixJ family response regulator